MKKMNAPVMETVRFTEDDVIVASGKAGYDNQSMYLESFGNTTTGDGFIRYNGTEYSGKKILRVQDSLDSQLGNTNPIMFNYETGDRVRLFAFINSDLGKLSSTDTAISSKMNGSYYWDGTQFVKR